MADPVFSQRVNEDVKEKLDGYMKDFSAMNDGATAKEFMAHLVELFELESMTKGRPEFERHVIELNSATSRIMTIFKDMCEGFTDTTSQEISRYEQSVSLRDREIERLREEIADRDMRLHNLSETMEKLVDNETQLNQRVDTFTESTEKMQEEMFELRSKCVKDVDAVREQAEDNIRSKQELVDSYKEKNDLLTGKLVEAEGAVSEVAQLRKDLEEASGYGKHLETTVAKLGADVTTLEQKLKDEVATLKGRHELIMGNALLEKDKLHQAEVNALTIASNAKIKELLEDFDKRVRKAPAAKIEKVVKSKEIKKEELPKEGN